MQMSSPVTVPVNITFIENARDVYITPQQTRLGPSTPFSAGMDLRACLQEKSISIAPGCREKIHTGIAIEPRVPGIAAFVYSRSGLGAVKGLTVAQGVGIIDPDYRGEICVFLLNTSSQPLAVENGDRIAQIVFQPYYLPEFTIVPSLGDSSRGEGGFGHTGTK